MNKNAQQVANKIAVENEFDHATFIGSRDGSDFFIGDFDNLCDVGLPTIIEIDKTGNSHVFEDQLARQILASF